MFTSLLPFQFSSCRSTDHLTHGRRSSSISASCRLTSSVYSYPQIAHQRSPTACTIPKPKTSVCGLRPPSCNGFEIRTTPVPNPMYVRAVVGISDLVFCAARPAVCTDSTNTKTNCDFTQPPCRFVPTPTCLCDISDTGYMHYTCQPSCLTRIKCTAQVLRRLIMVLRPPADAFLTYLTSVANQ